MKKVIYSLCLVFLLSACTTVSFLPVKDDFAYVPTDHVEIYFQEPEESYVIIGQLIVVSEESMEWAFKCLKDRAMLVGAHAIIMIGNEEMQNIMGFSTYYGGTSIIPYATYRLEAFAIRFESAHNGT